MSESSKFECALGFHFPYECVEGCTRTYYCPCRKYRYVLHYAFEGISPDKIEDYMVSHRMCRYKD